MSLAAVIQTYPVPNRGQLVGEGSYLVANGVGIASGAVGTGQTLVAAQTAFSDTGSPIFYIQNTEPSQGGRTLYLDYIKLISTAVGTAAVSWQYAVVVDVTPKTASTNHVSACVPFNPNSQAANISSPTILVQSSATASVWTASTSSSRTVARGAVGGVNIAGHEYFVLFGDMSAAGPYVGSTDTAAAPGRSGSCSGPVAVGPGGHNAHFHFWGPSSSASIAPEFEIGMYYR